MNITYLSLGTNLGNKPQNIENALRQIAERIGVIISVSNIYETEPQGFVSSEKFLNAAVKVETELSPQELLKETQRIERDSGRKTKSTGGKYSDRIIDIDILLYNDLKINTKELTIPHPRMYERDFVMKPLQEILTA
ncbi:MAG: 2-amino-4-hydroxy-6-hydroxymethyldihydropteridine diphosphokinase [Tannerella sp.]|jgi:2-amino-4-hydroxy-6-hydroxymethyldihydropteridine diphosphokinase|nr:2-amino-4-hydroxy-6-hydroxymethyldihydropteridine diphosphokinase [Tannerella sp.]